MAAVLVAAVALLSSCASATRPASAAPLPCRATGLTASGGRQGDGPGAQGDIEFTNTGRRPCLLRGVPQIAVVRAAGMTPLPVRARPPLYPLGPQAVLPPGQPGAGWLVVFWTNWCGPSPGPLRLQISLPDHGGTLDTPLTARRTMISSPLASVAALRRPSLLLPPGVLRTGQAPTERQPGAAKCR